MAKRRQLGLRGGAGGVMPGAMKRWRPFLTAWLVALAATASAGDRWNGHSVESIASAAKSTAGAGAWIVTGKDAAGGRNRWEEAGWRWIGPVGRSAAIVVPPAPGASLPPDVTGGPMPEWARLDAALKLSPTTGDVGLHVMGWGDATAAEAAVGGRAEPMDRGLWRIGVRVPASAVPAIAAAAAAEPAVLAVRPGGGARLLNARARRAVQSGTITTGGETLWNRGLLGQGERIAILDTGADPLSAYMAEADRSLPPTVRGEGTMTVDPSRRKIVAYSFLYDPDDPATEPRRAWDDNGHGTYVAGNAAASQLGEFAFSRSDLVPNGVAPAAQLVIQDAGARIDDCADLPALGCPLRPIGALLDQAHGAGARLHVNSWGDQENTHPQNDYTPTCADMDAATARHRDLLIVVAAGNSGARGEDSVGSPSTAKNVLSVGATRGDRVGELTTFSSIGWAEDGRIKPDLVAPGQTQTSAPDLVATTLHYRTATVQGTSMAAPVAAGAAALVRQYLREGYYPGVPGLLEGGAIEPSAALVKAMLIDGAAPLDTGGPPPTRQQGWGRVQLDRTLTFSDSVRQLAVLDSPASFSSAEESPFEWQFQSNGVGDLRVTLVYTDPPALPGANPALVNDLDLEVVTPGGTLLRGNRLDTMTGRSVPGGEGDRINNVEAVRLAGEEGVYTVRVRPVLVAEGPQDFALVITGALGPVRDGRAGDWWMLQ